MLVLVTDILIHILKTIHLFQLEEAEAGIFLFSKLRTGTHPFYINQAIHASFPRFETDAYMSAFLKSLILMQENLSSKGKFAQLPTYSTYQAFMGNETSALEKINFKLRMARRFDDLEQFAEDVSDEWTASALGELPPRIWLIT